MNWGTLLSAAGAANALRKKWKEKQASQSIIEQLFTGMLSNDGRLAEGDFDKKIEGVRFVTTQILSANDQPAYVVEVTDTQLPSTDSNYMRRFRYYITSKKFYHL